MCTFVFFSRQGLTSVVEKNHTVILGWTDRTVLIILEICEANSSEGGGVIAVLDEQARLSPLLDSPLCVVPLLLAAFREGVGTGTAGADAI